jgi:hypothetical protein
MAKQVIAAIGESQMKSMRRSYRSSISLRAFDFGRALEGEQFPLKEVRTAPESWLTTWRRL